MLFLAALGCVEQRLRHTGLTGRIEGRVVEEADAAPSPGVVMLRSTRMRGQVTTAPDGTFALAVPPGTYDVVARDDANYVLRRGVEVADGGVQHLLLEMKPRERQSCGSKLTPPEVISGPNPQYTMQAIENEVGGTMIVKCIATVEGAVHGCMIKKGQPYMDAAVVEALERRRYQPALCDGKPIEVDYSFKINLTPP